MPATYRCARRVPRHRVPCHCEQARRDVLYPADGRRCRVRPSATFHSQVLDPILYELLQRSVSLLQHLGVQVRLPNPSIPMPTQEVFYQSSQPSSLPFAAVGPPPLLFLIVLVPKPLGLDISSVDAPKLSQKSFLSGSAFLLPAAPPSCPSTNLLIDSAAPLAPD